jgi:HPr kinase/phosphorylase
MANPALTVKEILHDNTRDLKLRVIAGRAGLTHEITEPDLHRPGLVLAGFTELFQPQRIQIFGNTEIRYLLHLKPIQRSTALKKLFTFQLPCIIVTDGNIIPPELKQLAEEHKTPLLTTRFTTTQFSFFLAKYLGERFAPSITIHGTLVDVYGTGLLFIGRAGIGKSEIALDLIERGHRLVADDIVTLILQSPDIISGIGPVMLKHLIEVRGLGVIDVRHMFGVRAIRLKKRVETVVELVDWDNQEDYERLGLEDKYCEYLGVKIPLIRLPIYPGKNITVIAEAIALNLHLKVYGFNAARELSRRQSLHIRDKQRIQRYLKWDSE